MECMNQTHHATLVRCSPVQAYNLDGLGSFDEVQDIYVERFGIDDARRLVVSANNRPQQTQTQTLVVRADFVTHEAQNALLKILEEPPTSTLFVFVLLEGFQVLPTLASRFFEVQLNNSKEELMLTDEFSEFLKLSYAERLSSIDKAMKNKNVTWQQAVKQGLLQYLKKDCSDIIGELEFVSRFLLTRGASNKLLLEHLALCLPIRRS